MVNRVDTPRTRQQKENQAAAERERERNTRDGQRQGSPVSPGGRTKIPRMQNQNTPEHLYGPDKHDEMPLPTENKQQQDSVMNDMINQRANQFDTSVSDIRWYVTSWKNIALMLVGILIVMQAFLILKGNKDRLEPDFSFSSDGSVACLRSQEELRKKLALAFELIHESGKLFKQLEKQSKQQFERMEMKHDSLEAKATNEIGVIKKQLDILKSLGPRKGDSGFLDNFKFGLSSDKDSTEMTEIDSLIKIALAQYDADKIGIPDYALESAGGRIHVPHHSPTHSHGWPIMKIFGIVIWQDARTPREIIKPETLPGNCWPLEGPTGYVVIKLAAPITPSMVTMEHLNPSLARFIDDAWQSMPKNFSVFSWADEFGLEKTLLGSYTYAQNGRARQTFPVQTVPEQKIEYIELRIEDNYGNEEYTCIYRFRVHGEPIRSNDDNKVPV
eukprot:Seg1947.6 transcript_id=Seg1947.6/GoldUCD/mRNA.D3Y31 product="SUN domain-containing protein 2" protein_id=Seg1947.6/GoldUCD/D3Y31